MFVAAVLPLVDTHAWLTKEALQTNNIAVARI